MGMYRTFLDLAQSRSLAEYADRAKMPRNVHVSRPKMELGWIVLGLVGWALGLVFVLALFRMSGDQDRAARHEQKRLDPHSDVTITQFGNG
jgi:hypothetical protein